MKTKYAFILVLTVTRSLVFSQWGLVLDNPGVNSACYSKNMDSCFIGGMDGKIYRTTNSGASWDSVQTVFKTSWFLDIEFPSKSIGYACGGTAFGTHKSIITKTTNGGLTWDSIASDMYGYNLYAAHFLNDNVGFFAGEGCILKTVNGGLTFSLQTVPLVVYDFFFTSLNTGFFVGASKIYKTTDQGQTWSNVFTDTTFINSIFFTSNNIGFAVGNKGALLKTIDGGNTWTKSLITNDTIFLRDIQFLNNTTGYIAASRYQVAERGYIYKTTDGGNTWVQQLMTNIALSSISVTNLNEGYAAGYRKVFRMGQSTTSLTDWNSLTGQTFDVYPNPSAGIFTLALKDVFKGGSVAVYNGTGSQVRSIPVAEDIVKIALDDLPDGLYSLTFSDSGGKVAGCQKIIVSR